MVFSHWTGDVCVGSTQVDLPQASRVIGLMADALQEAVTMRARQAPPGDPGRRSATLVDRLLDRFRTASAQIVALADRQQNPGDPSASAASE